MDKKVTKEAAQTDRKWARWAYEMLRSELDGRRPDGSAIPRWDELSLNAQWKCGAVIDVLLHGTQQKRTDKGE